MRPIISENVLRIFELYNLKRIFPLFLDRKMSFSLIRIIKSEEKKQVPWIL